MSMEKLLGKTIKHDITKSGGLVLVSAGSVLDRQQARLLAMHGVDASEVRVMGEVGSGNIRSEKMLEASERSKELFGRIGRDRKVPLIDIKVELLPFVQEATEQSDVFQLFESVKAKDEYTHQHNIGVAVLSLLIGKWMELGETELALLSLAAVLHDVGKIRIPEHILLKPGPLTSEEFAEMKRHTVYGYEILKDTVGLNPRVALVALQHHERADGNGYPLRLTHNRIDPLSRIVAVADIFHAMSSARPYREALPFHEVVFQMRKGSFGELDPYVISVFLDNLIRHLIGREVRLTDGRRGVVVYINPHDDLHPLVKIGDTFLDLSEGRNIHIEGIIL
ncbi:HD-GYP domain-containing protein [Paenibacillus sp. MBLB4367]|uniref:HD-GYP domain-containing protein n=1 Tax=Paenibacillus sp. MBLB4367 TaxID=3384767 RepID=UPI003907FDE6